MMRKTRISIVLTILTGLCFVGAVHGAEQQYCPLCSMNLKMYWKTSHWLTFSDGTRMGYCSIHCASEVYQKRATEVDRWEVADYDTGGLIDARKAVFLIGSDLPGTMTAVSKPAFASPDTAKAYQKKHGGSVGTLDDALKKAFEGRGEDMALIKGRMAKMAEMGKDLAAKQGCYRCHGEGGSGGRAIGWQSAEFAREMDSRVKIKEKILRGGGRMPAFEGKLTEKELHAITLYIWENRAK